MCNNDIPVNLVADVDNIKKYYYVYLKVDTGNDYGKFLLATFFKKDVAFDYCSYLNESQIDSLFCTYFVEEETYEEI